MLHCNLYIGLPMGVSVPHIHTKWELLEKSKCFCVARKSLGVCVVMSVCLALHY